MNMAQYTMKKFSITDYLATGKENARTAREIADEIGIRATRPVTQAIERARRKGLPICAAVSGDYLGYYLTKDPAELKRYCSQLQHRAGEILTTSAAMIKGQEAANSGQD
jgi:hypothetical protein